MVDTPRAVWVSKGKEIERCARTRGKEDLKTEAEMEEQIRASLPKA